MLGAGAVRTNQKSETSKLRNAPHRQNQHQEHVTKLANQPAAKSAGRNATYEKMIAKPPPSDQRCHARVPTSCLFLWYCSSLAGH